MIIECRTQVELDAALKKASANHTIRLVGGRFSVFGSAHVEARDSARVEAWGSARVVACDSAHVMARGSAHVEARDSAHVEAWDSAHVVAQGSAHVEAWGSAHVEAWDSAHVEALDSAHVVARDSAHVEAWGNVFVRALSKLCRITASASVVVMLHDDEVKIAGGKKIKAAIPRTAEEWCKFYGAEVKSGIATVYKGVRDDYKSAHGTSYAPSTIPAADDWDGGKKECGGGLHFSPRPIMTRKFDSNATKFIACPVCLKDMRAPKPDDQYPDKIKAKGCCAPVWEVDIWGNKI